MHMTIPSISVVIPAYNASGTIGAAIESATTQTIVPSEIIIIDDMSRDNTCEIVQRYIDDTKDAAHIPILLLQQPTNSGPAAARNAGISAAKGEWIAFLDGDDIWRSQRIEQQLLALQEHKKAALICSPTLPLNEDNADLPFNETNSVLYKTLSLADFIFTNPVATSTVLVTREALKQTGGFDEQFCGPEDYDLWLRIVARYATIKTTEPLSLYRHVPGSLSMDDRTFLPQVIAVLEKAFSKGGPLEAHAKHKHRAYAEKYSSASWMAFNRNAHMTALRLLTKSFLIYSRKILPEERDPLLRIKLLLRYLRLYSGNNT
jgi:glycosyltransferase involved in cell wall biosynthesis